MLHLVDVLACTISIFKHQHSETTLSTLTELFDACAQRQKVVDYLAFVMSDVETIFSEDNIIQPRKDEFLFVQCSGSSNTRRSCNSEAGPESDAGDDADDADDADEAYLDDRDEDEAYSRGANKGNARKAFAIPHHITAPKHLILGKKRKQPRDKPVCNAGNNPASIAPNKRQKNKVTKSTTQCASSDQQQESNVKKIIPPVRSENLDVIPSGEQIHDVQRKYHVSLDHTVSKISPKTHDNLSRIFPKPRSQAMPTPSEVGVVGIKNALSHKIPPVFAEIFGQGGGCAASVAKKTKKKKTNQMSLLHTSPRDQAVFPNLNALAHAHEPANTVHALPKPDKKCKSHLKKRTSETSKIVLSHSTHAHQQDNLLVVMPMHKQCTNVKKSHKIAGDMMSTEASTAVYANSSPNIQKKNFIAGGLFAPASPKKLMSTKTAHSINKPIEKHKVT
jgi:hypothetical protein